MYINPKELTLSEEQISHFMHSLDTYELAFQSRANRDAVAKAAQQAGHITKKSSVANQSIDPRYTAEGQHLPDLGMANDRIYCTLYMLSLVG